MEDTHQNNDMGVSQYQEEAGTSCVDENTNESSHPTNVEVEHTETNSVEADVDEGVANCTQNNNNAEQNDDDDDDEDELEKSRSINKNFGVLLNDQTFDSERFDCKK